MCGIAGIIEKNGMDVSTKLLDMLTLIQHRGPDATGIAVYGSEQAVYLRVAIEKKELHAVLMNLVMAHAAVLSESTTDWVRSIVYAEMDLRIEEAEIPKLHVAINQVDGLYVHSLSRGMKVYKDKGTTGDLQGFHKVDKRITTHGIGHVRMATESAEDIRPGGAGLSASPAGVG